MKQTMAFAASHLSVLWKPYRWTSMTVMLLFMLVISVGTAKSQSKDQDNPTPLTSNVISGTVSPGSAGDKYYYSFVASPGEVTITLTVEAAGRDLVQVGFALFDDREVQLGAYKVATAGSGGTQQAVENVSVKRRQRVLVLISVTQYSTGHGKYRLRVSGPVEFGQEKSTGGLAADDPTTQRGVVIRECLDAIANTKGTLIIKMKDGSKKIIDLSEAETITIAP